MIAAAPRAADEEHTAAVAERRVTVDPRPAGMAWLMAYLTAAEAAEVMAAVNAEVDRRRAAGDNGPIDTLRADALVAATMPSPPGRPARSPRPGRPRAECRCSNRAQRRRSHRGRSRRRGP